VNECRVCDLSVYFHGIACVDIFGSVCVFCDPRLGILIFIFCLIDLRMSLDC
jgi:hypothetical protein